MPVTKFSWSNLKEHIRKFFWIYAAVIIIAVVLSNLLWTMTRLQTPIDQQVLVYMADTIAYPEAMDDIAEKMLAEGQKFDETLMEVNFEHLQFADPSQDYTSGMVLMARLTTGEADAFIASEDCMVALANLAALDLTEYMADGWLAEYGLEGQTVILVDEETGEETSLMAAIPLDSLTALKTRGAFQNEKSFLVIPANGTNRETTMKTLETMIRILTEESSK